MSNYRPSPSVAFKLDHPPKFDQNPRATSGNKYNLHWSFCNVEDDLKNCKSNSNCISPNFNSTDTMTSTTASMAAANLNRKFYDFYTFTERQSSHHHHHHQMYHHHHVDQEQNTTTSDNNNNSSSNNEGQHENSNDAISNSASVNSGGTSCSSSGSPPNDNTVSVTTGDTKIDGSNVVDEINDCYILDEESPNCIKETTATSTASSFSTEATSASKFNVKDNSVHSVPFKFKIDQTYTVSAFPINGQHGAQFDYIHYINHESNRSSSNFSNSNSNNLTGKNLSTDFKPKIRSRQRLRTIFTPEQKVKLEELFCLTIYPSTYEREKMALDLGVHESRIQVWFQNRRAKMKKSLTHFKETSSSSSLSSSASTVKAVSAHQLLMGDEIHFSSPKNFNQSTTSSPISSSSSSSSWGKKEPMTSSNLN